MTTTTMMTTTDTELTTDVSVPAAPRPAGAGRSRGQRTLQLWIASGCTALLAALVFVAIAIPLPYTTQDPGSATQVGPLMSVPSGSVPFYPAESSVAFTTVTQREATLFDLLRGWIDDDVDVFPNDVLYGGSSRAETRFVNAGLMNASKVAATTVALRRLGYDVTVRTNGTIVRQIGPDTPAAAALQLDDIITEVDGEPVDRFGEIRDLLQAGGPGTNHTLTVERPPGSGTFVEIPIATIAAEGEPGRAIIGITPEERLDTVDFPFAVDIDERRVGGPSAGLAFALGVIDVLTEGELTGGHKVAVTGTIDFDGNVGPVGGAKQKSAAVRNAGYEAFLVPPDELDEVREAIGGDVTVIPVSTLQEALDALASLGGDLSSLDPAGAAPAPR